MWRNVETAPADSILGLTEAFKNDTNPEKVNLGVGVYKDEGGKTPVLQCVKAAEKILLEKEETKSYLPITGDPLYASEVQKLLFGEDSEVVSTGRAVTAHAPGGTGALRVGAELLKKFNPDAKVWISSPTWANHKGVFSAAGFELAEYSYYDAATKSLDFDGMVESLNKVPAGDIVLLHTCCHNPSGVDLNEAQWKNIAEIGKERGWIPFLDFAYQGFGESVESDRCGVVAFAATGVDFFVASSFSKNFGLYNERTGAITVVAPNAEDGAVAMSHLKTSVRVIYSNPPAHGGLVVATILADAELKKQWLQELSGMCDRIKEMRSALVDGLASRGVEGDFSYITSQRGMFSFSGLSDDVVKWLRDNRSIYVVGGGRINLAGLTRANIDYVCDSIAEALKG
ncbi:amino acid aminotransferase [Desulforhopalus singaporensis]|uniref:Aromatic-amino-acid transaminase n=1 Tax=Desulforhopalus singaporensis TaxID=91360 RepID=A0A1H0RU87_9BACT|nr:amino acid aminotransferase [Desulforhopalus singaporensis]SDP32970.1 aromatic-amino-acid transaminase [Desulforhopalus singaporensis]